MAPSTANLSVRIVSYNVLSSHLACPSHFTHCQPEHLDAKNRLPKVLSKLEREIDSLCSPTSSAAAAAASANADKAPTIFCLQEVSYDWAGEFHAFFANHGYHLVTGLYGRKFNGYMGVALAYPLHRYETLDVDISRLSDKREGRWPREESAEASWIRSTLDLATSTAGKVWGSIVGPARNLLQLPTPKKDVDHWTMSENRFNVLLTATLRDKASNAAFGISNYHMPCAFYAPKVMNIHLDLAARRAQTLASRNGGVPHILAGDFNLMPDSAHYKLITRGELPILDPSYPTPKFGMGWEPTAKPMRSAYAETDHGEPDFTNYAQIKDDDPFIGTLDYIFLSNEWKVTGVENVVHRDVANGPYPNQAEPSDHVLIAADLEL